MVGHKLMGAIRNVQGGCEPYTRRGPAPALYPRQRSCYLATLVSPGVRMSPQ